jgi:hypothetical protein
MPRFVILCHQSPRGVHFDLMLEAGDVLKTWALPDSPQPGVEIECKSLGDHRVAYLDYEGPIAGNRGSVTRSDQGTYQTVEQDEAHWIIELRGAKLDGRATLRCTSEDRRRWSFRFSPVA